MSSIKRAFKNLFRRDKKSKPQQQQGYSTPAAVPSSRPQTTQQQQIPPPSSASTNAPAPQLPPIQSSSPMGSATETSRPALPPTHPLSTGRHERPQEAVPQNHAAQPGPPAPVTAASGGAFAGRQLGVDQLKDERTANGAVSPMDQGSVAEGARSGDVSAMDASSQAEENAKTDSAVEPIKAAEQNAATEQSPPPPAKENDQPNTTSSPRPATAEQPTQPASRPYDPDLEEKVAVTMEEPPPIRAVRVLPGMSATSGPLEEFPEGGFA